MIPTKVQVSPANRASRPPEALGQSFSDSADSARTATGSQEGAPKLAANLSGKQIHDSIAQPAGKGLAKNVSFITGCDESTAYQEHNPPSLLRRADAARNSDTPQAETVVPLKQTKISKKDELHILLAVTGSVATIKLPMIIHKLKQIYHKKAIIQVMATKASTVFFDEKELPKDVKVWYDADEWRSRTGKADNSLHVQLRRWADILLVAPCSANTLAKFAYGICDNLITSVFRVWNPAVPILLAPAMNTQMYTNPVTKRHYNILKEYFPYVEILRPVEKVLVCGDIGMGGMREWLDLVQTLVARLGVLPEDDDTDADDDSSSANQ